MRLLRKISISNIFILLLVSLISIVLGGFLIGIALEKELNNLMAPAAILISACCAIGIGVNSLRQSEKYKIQE